MPAAGDTQGVEGFYGAPPLRGIRDYSRDGVLRSLAESLRRLGLDRVDVALIHDPDDFLDQAADSAFRRWPNSAPRAPSGPSARG